MNIKISRSLFRRGGRVNPAHGERYGKKVGDITLTDSGSLPAN